MRNVYLDYSATTPVKEEVLKEMIPYFTEKFGNPSSLYDKGLESKDAVTHAREQVADLINAKPSEVYSPSEISTFPPLPSFTFTSIGATMAWRAYSSVPV